MFDKVVGFVRKSVNAVGGFLKPVVEPVKRFGLKLAIAGGMVFGAMTASATDPTPPDASTIVTTATTTFYTVGTLVASIVGFFIIVKIVKWIRK